MNFIKSNASLVKELNIQKKLEFCGRTCYNSTNAIKDGSDATFISGIIKRGHTSVLEHESICVAILNNTLMQFDWDTIQVAFTDKLASRFIWCKEAESSDYVMISANIRAWKNFLDLLRDSDSKYIHSKSLYNLFTQFLHILAPNVFEKGEWKEFQNLKDYKGELKLVSDSNISNFPSELRDFYAANKTYTFKIICSRACQNQLVRHRLAGFSVQSQRYCNYTCDKFGNSIEFITNIADEKSSKIVKELCEQSEQAYFNLIKQGCKPEDAREVLPNATATIVVMSAPKFEWDRVFELRCDSHAQEEIREICESIKNQIEGVRNEN